MPLPETTEIHFEIKTDEVNELLTAVPKWIVRWGITLIFFILLLAVSLSFFIKYPDVLTAQTTITTLNPPVTLVAKTSGKIALLNAKNNLPVKKGEVLLVIDNPANYKSIMALDSALTDFNKTDTADFIRVSTLSVSGKDGEELGDITPAFIAFLKCHNDYKLQAAINPQEKEIAIINSELNEHLILQTKYRTQETIYKEEFSLVEKDYNRSNTLLQNAAISPKEFEDKKREYLSAKRNYESIKITSINNTLAINNLEKNKLQLQMQAYQTSQQLAQALDQSVRALQSQIDTWQQTYLLKAPIAGTVSLYSYWNVNQNLKQGEDVLSIVPLEKQEIVAKLFLPVTNSGKLKVGQVVNIKLNNYLYPEYGMLNGFVKNISLMPKDNNYAVEVSLPNQLITSYHKQLDYKEEMKGNAEIITEELSVFQRVFYQLRKILKK